MAGFVEMTNTFDPLKKYKGQPLREAMGLIPYFIIEAATRGPTGAREVLDYMNEAYGFGGPEMTGGTIEEDGTYTYPEDPDLYPYAKFNLSGPEGSIADVFVYPYAIVAVRDDKETLLTRMD